MKAGREALLPACTRFAFQTPRGSPAAPLLGLQEPLRSLLPARLQIRAPQLHKGSSVLHLHASRLPKIYVWRRNRSCCSNFSIHRIPHAGAPSAPRRPAFPSVPLKEKRVSAHDGAFCYLDLFAPQGHRRDRGRQDGDGDAARGAAGVLLSAGMEK